MNIKEYGYKCESCGKSFTSSQYLTKHMHTIHEGYKDHKCESCEKSFTRANVLKMHIQTIHEGHKDYNCESCSKSFSQEALLKKHITEDWHSLAIRKKMLIDH